MTNQTTTKAGERTQGKAVTLNKRDGVWASYRVATVGDLPAPEILYAGATLKNGKSVQFFLNRETNLICVDIIDANNKGGREILRYTA